MAYRRSVLTTFISILGFTLLPAQTQKGKATYYSRRATGARTASGERLHHDSLTCAHRTHPFGTLLKVTNPSNGKDVIVKVTDRGPFARGRIIDLSWGAAKQLGILAQGVATVLVEVYKEARSIPYRPEETPKLPEIEFGTTEAGYSVVDNWASESPQETKTPTSSLPKKTAEKPHGARQAMPAKPQTNPQNKQTNPQNKQANPQNKKEKEGKVWSNLFNKLKRWRKNTEK